MPAKPYSYSYAVLRYVKDERRDVSVPVGIALWSPDANWVQTRMLSADERIEAIKPAEDYPFVNLVDRKISAWIRERQLPYEERPLSPTTDLWWRHLQKILVHRVRLSEPRPIDSTNPEADIESLFEDLVLPQPVMQLCDFARTQGAHRENEQRVSALGAMGGSVSLAQTSADPFVTPTPTPGGYAYAALSGHSS